METIILIFSVIIGMLSSALIWVSFKLNNAKNHLKASVKLNEAQYEAFKHCAKDFADEKEKDSQEIKKLKRLIEEYGSELKQAKKEE